MGGKYGRGWRRRDLPLRYRTTSALGMVAMGGDGLPTPTSRKVPQPSPFSRAFVTSHAAPPVSQARTLDRSESMTGPAGFRFKPSRIAHVEFTFKKLDVVVQIIKKRNSAFYQHDDEIELDIDSVDVESLWDLERIVTNYKKNLSKQKRKTELALQARGTARTAPVMNSAPMVAGALNSNTGRNNTSALATNAEVRRQMDNASSSSSSSSDSGSSSSDSDSDNSSGSGSEMGN
ncbi:hypothetical protein H5410_064726 [Solanum commersonii]|uniref:NET domain-containing protein n=1 Tax=Solanum commersonii TaxID=4109 RepID=A0A9J5VYJ4_SOLCO|nr:hypothetical protein H5410_064726 [Solanum commersonii]